MARILAGFLPWIAYGALAGAGLTRAAVPAGRAPPPANGAPGAVAWGTLAARPPFTAEYAREDWPPPYWTSPLFRRLNLALTAVWGAVFTVNAGLGAVALSRPTARVWLALAVPQLLVAGGGARSGAL